MHRLMFDFDTTQLAQFMRRTTRIGELDEAHVRLYKNGLRLQSLAPEGLEPTSDKKSRLTITCRKNDWRLSSFSSLAQILTSFFPFIHMVEHLYIQLDGHQFSPSPRQAAIDKRLWLEIFRLFTAVKSLYICKEFAECKVFARGLQEFVGEGVITTLPALESLFLEELQSSEPVQEAIEQFVAARQLLGHPSCCSVEL